MFLQNQITLQTQPCVGNNNLFAWFPSFNKSSSGVRVQNLFLYFLKKKPTLPSLISAIGIMSYIYF